MTDQPRPAFIIKATYILHPDDIAPYKSLAGAFAESTSQSSGCAYLHATQDVLDPAVFHLIEGWESQQALARNSSATPSRPSSRRP